MRILWGSKASDGRSREVSEATRFLFSSHDANGFLGHRRRDGRAVVLLLAKFLPLLCLCSGMPRLCCAVWTAADGAAGQASPPMPTAA
jgi:hypothetical protein